MSKLYTQITLPPSWPNLMRERGAWPVKLSIETCMMPRLRRLFPQSNGIGTRPDLQRSRRTDKTISKTPEIVNDLASTNANVMSTIMVKCQTATGTERNGRMYRSRHQG